MGSTEVTLSVGYTYTFSLLEIKRKVAKKTVNNEQ